MSLYYVDEDVLSSMATIIKNKINDQSPLSYPTDFIYALRNKYQIEYEDDQIISFFNQRNTLSTLPSEFCSDVCTIGNYAFTSCLTLRSVEFPVCDLIGSNAFYSCSNLEQISFPNCTKIDYGAFRFCYHLSIVSLPLCYAISNYAFGNCSALHLMSLPKCSIIFSTAFSTCYNFTALILMGSSIPFLSGGKSALSYTPFSNSSYLGYYGSIYVPSSLLSDYRNATGWSYYNARFIGVSVPFISFTIDNVKYTALSGNTWSTWAYSTWALRPPYYSLYIQFQDSNVYTNSQYDATLGFIGDENGNAVTSQAQIINGHNYATLTT